MDAKTLLEQAFAEIVSEALVQGVPVSVVCSAIASSDETDGPSAMAVAIRVFGEEYERLAPGMIGWRL